MNEVAMRAAHIGGKTLKSGLDAGVTIAARTPSFFNAGFDPTGADAREVEVAVTEKMQAAWDGALSALSKMGDLWLSATFGKLTTDDAAMAWWDVCDAAMAPAQVCVSANARRLTR